MVAKWLWVFWVSVSPYGISAHTSVYERISIQQIIIVSFVLCKSNKALPRAGSLGVYISALCVPSVCLWECVLGTCPALTRRLVCACLCVSARVLCAAARSLSTFTCARSQALHVRQPPCARPRVTCAQCARTSGSCALGALVPVFPHARMHLHMSGCTSPSVYARSVCTPPVSVCGALHARARACGRPGTLARLHAPRGADLLPLSPCPFAGLRDWPPAPSQPSPLPPPATRAPAVPAVPRGSGEAAPRCAPLPLAARAFVWRQLRPQRL